jgi:hypothetical protein
LGDPIKLMGPPSELLQPSLPILQRRTRSRRCSVAAPSSLRHLQLVAEVSV